ncbi:MAG: hypothetical protein ACE10E_06210 [Acidiferrobacterales bacterium]|nr:hypothetical protein [Gammaproteobacteria bacterium]
MSAASASSRYFCGLDRWDETRILLLAQALALPMARMVRANRAPFGSGYETRSPLEYFE